MKKHQTVQVLTVGQKKDGKFTDLLLEWQNFWKGIDGKDYDFSNIHITEKPEGHWRLLIIADATLEALYAKCRERFSCRRWTDDDFDKIVIWNERDAKNGPYAIWVKNETEADENLKNLSANDIKQKGITTETLDERFVNELKFFDETGKHLDVISCTLCTGSRGDDALVPSVHSVGNDSEINDSEMYVNSEYSHYWDSHLRARRVVS